jgi:hypothetical protein
MRTFACNERYVLSLSLSQTAFNGLSDNRAVCQPHHSLFILTLTLLFSLSCAIYSLSPSHTLTFTRSLTREPSPFLWLILFAPTSCPTFAYALILVLVRFRQSLSVSSCLRSCRGASTLLQRRLAIQIPKQARFKQEQF